MSSGNIVKLNIGGIVFQTSKSTLTKFDGFFKKMLETDIPLEKDESGAIFIDRDPKHFRLILNYMRDGCVNIPDSKAATQEIQTEAQYYLLDGLVELCNSQKPVTKETKNRCLETHKEIINAVANSTKKAVILFSYRTTSQIHYVMDIFEQSKILMKCFEDFDFYFYPYDPTYFVVPECRVCDKSTGKWSSVSQTELNSFLKESYGIE